MTALQLIRGLQTAEIIGILPGIVYIFFLILSFLVLLGWLWLLAVLCWSWPRFRPLKEERGSGLKRFPKVSILVPARDEEHNLEECLRCLLALDYPDYEIVVIDDRSRDGTLEIARRLKRENPSRLKVLHLDKSEEGWSGKNYALHRGISLAGGEWFLFTDADTRHYPESLRLGISKALEDGLGVLTFMTRLECRTFWEKMIQPIAGGLMLLWYPPDRLNDPRSPLGFANGQFLLIERNAYGVLGGHEAVRDKLLEDVALAERAKKLGVRFRIANGVYAVRTRMYRGLRESWNGWKRIFLHLAERNALEILESLAGFVFLGLGPVILFACALLTGVPRPLLALTAGVLGFSILIRGALNVLSRVPVWPALLYPLGSAAIAGMLAQALWESMLRKKTLWRGRHY
jgi:chlorobactene glucosyltransferase